MAWESRTEPEFESKLEWIRSFVRDEIWPIETIVADLDQQGIDDIYRPLQDEVKAQGLWALVEAQVDLLESGRLTPPTAILRWLV
jgi:acyl-CoA dehydrogenase